MRVQRVPFLGALALAAVFALSLAACGQASDNDADPAPTSAPPAESAPEGAPKPVESAAPDPAAPSIGDKPGKADDHGGGSGGS